MPKEDKQGGFAGKHKFLLANGTISGAAVIGLVVHQVKDGVKQGTALRTEASLRGKAQFFSEATIKSYTRLTVTQESRYLASTKLFTWFPAAEFVLASLVGDGEPPAAAGGSGAAAAAAAGGAGGGSGAAGSGNGSAGGGSSAAATATAMTTTTAAATAALATLPATMTRHVATFLNYWDLDAWRRSSKQCGQLPPPKCPARFVDFNWTLFVSVPLAPPRTPVWAVAVAGQEQAVRNLVRTTCFKLLTKYGLVLDVDVLLRRAPLLLPIEVARLCVFGVGGAGIYNGGMQPCGSIMVNFAQSMARLVLGKPATKQGASTTRQWLCTERQAKMTRPLLPSLETHLRNTVSRLPSNVSILDLLR